MMKREASSASQFSAESIREVCPLSDAYRIEVYPVLESTNRTMRERARLDAPNGTVIFADSQTAGRGRLGRSFFSPKGSGIYMTLLLRPRFSPELSWSVTTFAAVATARAIEAASGLRASVKWVNDVFVGEKKVSGILAESALDPSGKGLSYIALGIGINVNETAFPRELREIATSLALECGKALDRSRVAAYLLRELEPLLSGDAPSGYLDEYRQRNLVTGRRVTVISSDRSYTAVGKCIDDTGNLVVVCEDGSEQSICAGEVSLRL